MNYTVNNGVYFLDQQASELERDMLRDFEDSLIKKQFNYLSIPSSLTWDTLQRQEVIDVEGTLFIDSDHILSGSAEQGILERFINQEVAPSRYYAKNTCFRVEPYYETLRRNKEFTKIEQFVFCHKDTWENEFDLVMENATLFLERWGITHRIVDKTIEDEGYHIKKLDIEIQTRKGDWIESHSCTYFGDEQLKRFNIKGVTGTISNTGIATPRILLPFIEA